MLRQRDGSRERAQALGTSLLGGDRACCTVVLWRQKALRRCQLPPRMTCALLFPSAQRHFHLQRHTQQHCALSFWGNHLPLANIPVATFWREGKELSGESLAQQGGLGRRWASSDGSVVLRVAASPAKLLGCKSPCLSIACCAGLPRSWQDISGTGGRRRVVASLKLLWYRRATGRDASTAFLAPLGSCAPSDCHFFP